MIQVFNPIMTFDQTTVTVINKELEKVYIWLCANKLSLNIKKTKYILFHNPQKSTDNALFRIKINNTEIERVSTFNFLGVIIDEHLNWKFHIDSICSKLSRTIGILCKLKHYLPLFILRTLYNSLFLSHSMVFFHGVAIHFGHLSFKKRLSESLQIASIIPILNQFLNPCVFLKSKIFIV